MPKGKTNHLPHIFLSTCKECNREFYVKQENSFRSVNFCSERCASRNLYYRSRKEILLLLGNKCSNPYNLPHPEWCNDFRCLQIDHIHGGGRKERKELGTHDFTKRVLLSLKNGEKGKYQLLCANCNQLKKVIEKEQPSGKNGSCKGTIPCKLK